MGNTKSDMEQLLDMRNEESRAFVKALKDDADAVALIEKAIVSLTQFYKNNKLPLDLVQKKQEPAYSVDEDKAPETTFSGGYGGRKGESGGIIAILEMIKEDTENEIKVSRQDDADAEATYEKNRAALKETLDAQTDSKVQAGKELAATEAKSADTEETKNGKSSDLAEEQKLERSLLQQKQRVQIPRKPRMARVQTWQRKRSWSRRLGRTVPGWSLISPVDVITAKLRSKA